jgi:ankyrin repeat protein
LSCHDKRTGFGLLHLACASAHQRVVETLLSHSVNVNAIDNSRQTALHVCAAGQASVDGAYCVSLLLSSPDIDINARDSASRTPLHVAVSALNDKIVEILVEKGCDKRAADEHGKTALHIAVANESLPLARYLLRRAAPVTAHDNSGKTPLDYCRQLGQIAILKGMTKSKRRLY